MLGLVFTFASNYYVILIGKNNNNDFWAVVKGGSVVCEVSCWHKKMAIGLLAASARTATKILPYCWFHGSSFKGFSIVFLLPDWLKLSHLKSRMECGFSDIFRAIFVSP